MNVSVEVTIRFEQEMSVLNVKEAIDMFLEQVPIFVPTTGGYKIVGVKAEEVDK